MLAIRATPREGPSASGPAWPQPSRLQRESCCSSLRNAEPQRRGRKQWEITAASGRGPRGKLHPNVNSASGWEVSAQGSRRIHHQEVTITPSGSTT